MEIIDNHIYRSYISREHQCRKNIDSYKKIQSDNLTKIADFEGKIDSYHLQIKEINFDIEVIEDPISRPLGTGQENKRIEILIRQLESDVKKLESKIHWYQSKLISVKMHIEEYERKIQQEKNHLVTLADSINKLIRNAISHNDKYAKVQNIKSN